MGGEATIPLGWIATAGGAMCAVIVALWLWGLKLSKKNEALHKDLLNEKEEKFRILQGLEQKAEEAKKKRGNRS